MKKELNRHEQEMELETLSIEEGRSSDPFSYFKMLLNRKNFKRLDLDPGEKIVFTDYSTHLKNLESVGGKLFLTDKRLIFISHRFNIQNHMLYLNRNDIAEVGTIRMLIFLRKGLLIKTINGKREKFAVEKIEKWLERLK